LSTKLAEVMSNECIRKLYPIDNPSNI
jgi:hypothetical protein